MICVWRRCASRAYVSSNNIAIDPGFCEHRLLPPVVHNSDLNCVSLSFVLRAAVGARMAPKKPSTTAEVALVPLKNCLVNLPPSTAALLVNANAVSSLYRPTDASALT